MGFYSTGNQGVRKISTHHELRYVYILDIEWIQGKTFYGQKQFYYTGQTGDLGRRLSEHLNRNYGFVGSLGGYIKKLVFVKYIVGNEFDAMREEKRIKLMTSQEKKQLIQSDGNMLIHYFPFKNIVLKKNGTPEEQYIIPLSPTI